MMSVRQHSWVDLSVRCDQSSTIKIASLLLTDFSRVQLKSTARCCYDCEVSMKTVEQASQCPDAHLKLWWTHGTL